MKKKWLLGGAAVALCGVLVVGLLIANPGQWRESWKFGIGGTKQTVRYTPSRLGIHGSVMSARLSRSYDLTQAILESDLIADVTIVSWLGDYPSQQGSHGPLTYFSARVNAVFKGDPDDIIILNQAGNSTMTFDNYPLHQVGDRMIMFLRALTENEHAESFVEYDGNPPYGSLAWMCTIMDVQSINGTLFVSDRFGHLTDEIVKNFIPNEDFNFSATNIEIIETFHKQMEEQCPILAETRQLAYNNVLGYEELVDAINVVESKGIEYLDIYVPYHERLAAWAEENNLILDRTTGIYYPVHERRDLVRFESESSQTEIYSSQELDERGDY